MQSCEWLGPRTVVTSGIDFKVEGAMLASNQLEDECMRHNLKACIYIFLF